MYQEWQNNKIPRSPKISYTTCLNIWYNLLDPVRKRQRLISIRANGKTLICPQFFIIKDGCIENNGDMPLIDPSTNLLPYHIWDLPYQKIILNSLKLIIHLIESTFTSLNLSNLYPFLWVIFTWYLKPLFVSNAHHSRK